MLSLLRASVNPIITPSSLPWENKLVFNPGAVVHNDQVHLLYRAIGEDGISRLGLAKSTDGINFQRNLQPVYAGGGHEYETLGIEDPRVVKIEDTFYIVYAAVSEDKNVEINPNWKEKIAKKPQIALSTTKNFIDFIDYDVIIPEVGKDASFFPKKINGQYWLLYRTGIGPTYVAKSSNPSHWENASPVFDKRKGFWDSNRTGIGASPIETEKGWLLFYHGVDDQNTYRLGIMFLDINNPTKILYRSPFPVLEPQTIYEKTGFIQNVVFSCGAIEKDGKYFVYYGAADKVIGVATIEKAAVLHLF